MTGLVVAAGGLLNAVGFAQIAGDTPAARALFAQQMELLARQLTYLLPVPAQLDTMAGYLTWRWFGSAVLIYAFWALLAGAGAGPECPERVDEDGRAEPAPGQVARHRVELSRNRKQVGELAGEELHLLREERPRSRGVARDLREPDRVEQPACRDHQSGHQETGAMRPKR